MKAEKWERRRRDWADEWRKQEAAESTTKKALGTGVEELGFDDRAGIPGLDKEIDLCVWGRETKNGLFSNGHFRGISFPSGGLDGDNRQGIRIAMRILISDKPRQICHSTPLIIHPTPDSNDF